MKDRLLAITPYAELRAENRRLQAERDAAFAMSKCECAPDECCANLVRLHDEIKRLRKDAERYRWLRDAGMDDCGDGPWSRGYAALAGAPQQADEIIDAAMREEP